ncbi:MAG TPA: hypothetical protein VLN48_04655 [Bryobacteraceae bacterium]|nr:hypothetical protein [Bryobacteraceae bacterium]
MKRRVLNVALAALLSGLAGAFAADPLPSAESVLDRYVQVTGGKQAYARRKSEIAHGTLVYTAIGIKGSITRYAAEPDKYYATLDIEGLGKVEMGVNGSVAWENSALLGPRLKTGVERAEAIREGTMNSSANWRKLYPKVENQGIETIDGEECFKVVMTPAEGQPMVGYYQKKSGLQVKLTSIASTQMGDIPVELIASEYKDFGGILEPSKVTQKTGPQEFTITLDSVEANPAIPPGRFDLPADVRKLVEKAPVQ